MAPTGDLEAAAGRLFAKPLFRVTIEPGAPWQNPFVESFNGHLRRELLEMESFNTLFEASCCSTTGASSTTTTDPTNP